MTRHTFSSLADTATWPNSLFQLPRSEVRESQGASSSPARGAQPRFGPGPSDAPPRLAFPQAAFVACGYLGRFRLEGLVPPPPTPFGWAALVDSRPGALRAVWVPGS